MERERGACWVGVAYTAPRQREVGVDWLGGAVCCVVTENCPQCAQMGAPGSQEPGHINVVQPRLCQNDLWTFILALLPVSSHPL